MNMFSVFEDCASKQDIENEQYYLKNASWKTRFKYKFRELFLASQHNPSGKRYLRSRAAINFEKRRQCYKNKHTIHPFSKFRHYWDIMMLVTILIGLICIPFQAAFDMKRVKKPWWTSFKSFIIFICLVDILLNFHTGYFDKAQSIVELRKRKISFNYLTGYFILDFLGSIPTDIFFLNYWDTMIVRREVYSLIFAFRIFSFLRNFESIGMDISISRSHLNFTSTITWLLVLFHWEACLHWIGPLAAMSMGEVKRPKHSSWIHAINLWDNNTDFNVEKSKSVEQYLHCLLRAISSFLRGGNLVRAEPKTPEDKLLAIASLFLGTLIFCYLIARTMQFFKGTYSSKLTYQSALSHLKMYMSHKQLPRRTQDRIEGFYEFKFQSQYFRESEILSILSVQMRQEIRMHSCRKLVENVSFFNNLPLSLLARIVALLKAEIFLTNDLICRANSTGNCMYFIATGTVAVYTSTGKEVCHLEDGAHFGEIALVMPDAKRVASVVAVEYCKLYRLERADFSRTIHPYPMLWERIRKIALDRHEKTTILAAQ